MDPRLDGGGNTKDSTDHGPDHGPRIKTGREGEGVQATEDRKLCCGAGPSLPGSAQRTRKEWLQRQESCWGQVVSMLWGTWAGSIIGMAGGGGQRARRPDSDMCQNDGSRRRSG